MELNVVRDVVRGKSLLSFGLSSVPRSLPVVAPVLPSVYDDVAVIVEAHDTSLC